MLEKLELVSALISASSMLSNCVCVCVEGGGGGEKEQPCDIATLTLAVR